MADDLSDLRLFTHLVAAGNLSEAARRLNSSTPAMSRRLAAMETRLGVRLVDRGSRRFVLTEEGAILHDRSLHILAELDDAEAEASTGGAVPRGHLRIRAPTQVGRQRIACIVTTFVQQFPKVEIELLLSDAEPDLAGENVDIAFTVGQPNEASLITRNLIAARRVVICAAPDYFARHGMPRTPEDLARHNCIRLVRGRRVFDHWGFVEDGVRRERRVEGNLSTTSSEVVSDWALAGLGMALRLPWDIEDHLAQGRLVRCLEPFTLDERSLYIAFVSRNHMPPRVRAFIDFSVAQFRNVCG